MEKLIVSRRLTNHPVKDIKDRNMVALLTILGTIFLIVSAIFWSATPKLKTVDIVIGSVAAILMTLCYVGSVFAQYMIEFIK